MKLDQLLAKLKGIDVIVAEERKLADGKRILLLTAKLDFFPLAPHRRWYPLVLLEDQKEIAKEEVAAIQRHFWHSELNWFPADDLG